MINSTLFSFQRTILRHPSELSEGLPWISFYILSHSFELVKNFFVLFSRPEQWISCRRRCSTLCCSLTTCIILHGFITNVNTFLLFYSLFYFFLPVCIIFIITIIFMNINSRILTIDINVSIFSAFLSWIHIKYSTSE